MHSHYFGVRNIRLEHYKNLFCTPFQPQSRRVIARHTSAPGIGKNSRIPGLTTPKNAVFSRSFSLSLPGFPESRRKLRFFPGGRTFVSTEETKLHLTLPTAEYIHGFSLEAKIRVVSNYYDRDSEKRPRKLQKCSTRASRSAPF